LNLESLARGLASTAAVAAALLAAASLVSAEGLNVKTGQWSWTITLTGLPEPPASVPPDVAAKIREEAKKPHTALGCVSADDLRNLRLGRTGDEEQDCKATQTKSTATTAEFVRACTGDEPRTETVRVEAATPESMRITATRTGGSGPSGVTMVGKWVGAACREE